MTPARKAALQWFHDRGEVHDVWVIPDRPSTRLIRIMIFDGQIEADVWQRKPHKVTHRLTDKGRRMLNGEDG